MRSITVAPSPQALLGLVEGPAMVSKHVRIGTYIVDAVILDAHPEVATSYGYQSPADLQGRYLSQLHDAKCLARVRVYAVARQLGFPDVPTAYDMRINLPNGTQRWLRKHQVRQITDGGEVYWISHSLPIPDAQATPLPAMTLPLPLAELEDHLGQGTFANAESVMAYALAHAPIPHSTSSGASAPVVAPSIPSLAPLPTALAALADRLPASIPLYLPQRLQQLRQLRRLSQKALAQRAGVSNVTISRIEQSLDASQVTIDTVVRLAWALDVRIDTLVGFDAE